MNCPNCGANLPDGTLSCPNCAAPIPSQAGFSNPMPVNTMPKKSNKGLIIGIACGAVVVIAAVILCIVLFSGSQDGTYVNNDFEDYGIDCTLTVDGNKCELKMSGYGESTSEKGTIKFNGKKVTITFDGEKSEGTYNKSKKTIEIDGMTFKKK